MRSKINKGIKSQRRSRISKHKKYKNHKLINLFNQLHGLENNIKHNILKTENFKKKNQSGWANVKSQSGYEFDELNQIHNIQRSILKVNHNLLSNINQTKAPRIVKSITDNYARGVSQYINHSKKYKMNFKISNAFCKLWEIFESVPDLLPNRNNLKIFHIAEAPGQWIYSINYYIKKRRPNVKNYDWRANSLNPHHPTNIAIFGNEILKDDYGFIKKYADKWIWGHNDTGDITKLENLKWYRQYIKEWKGGKVDLITGDAGLQTDNPAIYQKLELGQVYMVASSGQKGSNCVIKHFLPYIVKIPETYESSGFFLNYIYVYYLMFEEVYMIKPLSSNPVSSEFYLVGKNFIGLKEDDYNHLVETIDNYEVNFCIFKKEELPENFKKQVFNFIEKLTRMNIDYVTIQNTLLTCIKGIDKKQQECKYLDSKYMKEIQEAKFTQWIETFNFT